MLEGDGEGSVEELARCIVELDALESHPLPRHVVAHSERTGRAGVGVSAPDDGRQDGAHVHVHYSVQRAREIFPLLFTVTACTKKQRFELRSDGATRSCRDTHVSLILTHVS